jgi:hypothetical protein
LALVGVRAKTSGVILDVGGSFVATFGWLRPSTPISNIDAAHVTKNYRWWTAIGPRMSFVDDGLTFGTNTKAGVCVHFKDKVPSLLRRKGHSALTVTVSAVEGLVRDLEGHMHE